MLIHICCSVDSHYFFDELLKQLDEKEKSDLKAFFYNPNIHPKEEYELRLNDVKRSCKIFNIPLIEGEYDIENYLSNTEHLSKEKEGAKRCDVCFDMRFEESAKMASSLNMNSFTSTLLVSPKKDIAKLKKSGEKLAEMFHVKFKAFDFKGKDFTSKIKSISNKENLYKQDYCGCIYAMRNEYENKKELMSDALKRVLPNDIGDRVFQYKLRDEYEKDGIEYKLIKQKIVNYRLLNGYLKYKNEVIPSYIIHFSEEIKRETKFKANLVTDGIAYTNRYDINIVDIDRLNRVVNRNFGSVKELLKNPLTTEEEDRIRKSVLEINNRNSIFIVDKIERENYKGYIKAIFFNDTITIIKKIR